ncbi:MAG: GGDEF domain-containing protein [Hydrogenophilales bacterium]|nr:GGDEF domain-containing protein [Hydrogenophilales bacterium]
MPEPAQPHRPSASLQRHLGWLLLSVVGMFGSGIGLSLWFSLESSREDQQQFIQHEAEQTNANLIRRLDYYRMLLANLARDPELQDVMQFGSTDEKQQWALSRQRLLPEILGLALVDPQGEAEALRIGPACRQDLRRPGALTDGRLLMHRELTGAEHVDLIAPVRDVRGDMLGGVFLSMHLTQFQRVIDAAIQPGHAIALADESGQTIVSRGEINGPMRELRLPVADTGWTLIVQTPVQWLTRSGWRQVMAGLLTLGAVLLVLVVGMVRLRRTMRRDIVSTVDALTALARDEPVPTIVPRYVEFETVAADINMIALHLQEQRARLAHLSLTDPLTGLPNRRAFETRFPQAQGLAERQHPVALVMLDIDHFKGVNDRYGHGVGDQVLLALAQSLKALTRRADLAARLAGDEFAVLLSDLDAAGVDAWYQRLSDHFRSELNAFGLELNTGLSAGQTWLGSASGDTLNDALARADRALYQAKARGRGQLVQDAAPGADGTE